MDPTEIYQTIFSRPHIAVFFATILSGAVGGWVRFANGSRPTAFGDRIIIGAVMALAFMATTAPSTAVALVGGSIAAGFAGEPILRTLATWTASLGKRGQAS